MIRDVHARYFGAELDDRSLTPAGKARIGAVRFADWLRHSSAKQVKCRRIRLRQALGVRSSALTCRRMADHACVG